MTLFIDTNIFIRSATFDSNVQSQQSIELLTLIHNGKYKSFTSSHVLAEFVWVLGSFYKYKKAQVNELLQSIHSIQNLSFINDVDESLAMVLFKENNVKYIDTLIASIPEISKRKCVVVSYDHDFDKLGVKRLEPKDLL